MFFNRVSIGDEVKITYEDTFDDYVTVEGKIIEVSNKGNVIKVETETGETHSILEDEVISLER